VVSLVTLNDVNSHFMNKTRASIIKECEQLPLLCCCLAKVHCMFTHVWVNYCQRHLSRPPVLWLGAGRYEDDITAGKAYDKAAVYLYGANAITNFGHSLVAEDPTEVSSVQIYF
jgi:hypothetical protein